MTDEAKIDEQCFVDSNIWFYAFNRLQDQAKHQIASDLIQASAIWISTQVINEVCRNLIKKASFQEAQIFGLISAFYSRYQVVELNREILIQASSMREHYLFSFWDSLIVASAMQAGASILYSEDMQTGLVISNQLEIVNPFQCPSN